ncbi:hypothetical protein BDN72DRAFT_841239 [Pluteus cervinus]|uniref:Uncharacterized protein n=1 Tax=Pluteus cervinus TaxID=181527 RepID=A0ACD3AVE4_9AGAR|nr:hypothetical protein BDN72DRAFT_841239 [Pluteus cervinus]
MSNTPANKIAMSRALGAAFLNHQVEQLEKSVHNGPGGNYGGWRDRRYTPQPHHNEYSGKRTSSYQSGGYKAVSPGGGNPLSSSPLTGTSPGKTGDGLGQRVAGRKQSGDIGFLTRDRAGDTTNGFRRRSNEEDREVSKDADIIVVDASVLVNALYQVKKWCRDGREEILIVPLEALNTLDLLKKGTSALAQRARAASRILEAQVGTNPRIRVQRDDAFVLWDKINFKETTELADDNSRYPSLPQPSPEWVRRTICCACYEIENAVTKTSDINAASARPTPPRGPFKVALAILSTPPNLSPKTNHLKLTNDSAPMNPVPLPAPAASKPEPRSSGVLVSHWAARAKIEMLEIAPTAPPQALANGRHSEEEDRGIKPRAHSHSPSHHPKGRRLSNPHGNSDPPTNGRSALVERPPAVLAMMEMVSQPKKTIKLLARGEKLDPDT